MLEFLLPLLCLLDSSLSVLNLCSILLWLFSVATTGSSLEVYFCPWWILWKYKLFSISTASHGSCHCLTYIKILSSLRLEIGFSTNYTASSFYSSSMSRVIWVILEFVFRSYLSLWIYSLVLVSCDFKSSLGSLIHLWWINSCVGTDIFGATKVTGNMLRFCSCSRDISFISTYDFRSLSSPEEIELSCKWWILTALIRLS
jgi:hypothetical protein